MQRTFDRYVRFDPQSKQYPILATIDRTQPRSYTWRCRCWFDQGREGACVGHGWAHEACARPYERQVEHQLAWDVYNRARQIDEWAGEDYDGTSVLAGAKAMVEFGYIKEYRWAFGLSDLKLAVAWKGPAVLGINWYEGMYDVDSRGYLKPDGDAVGGHCILATGVNIPGRYFTVHNSWGQTWGRNGKARISWDDMDRLLNEQGEACIPLVRV